ncbi:MAG TPA: recombinase family protein [Longimicrobium sp.]|jgi:DNA invertase Pin-like site-specific DNA recombinase|uniref:recombinase family protein n=1 Tax=Longimicrobium sp. TaxID=2029185 RepID=UPI002ED90944
MRKDTDTIGYRRVSTGEQAVEWKTSLQDQTRAVKARARALGRVLEDEFIWEDRFSGEDAESRPAFMQLVNYCRTHPRTRKAPGYAIFLNDSRFGRFADPDEAAAWRFELSKHGWIARFAENDDTESVTTRHLIRSIGGSQASEYLANLKANARRGARGAAAQGLWQNEAPFGYRRMATAPGRPPVVLEHGQRKSKDQKVRLTPGPKREVEMVVWMYQRYAAGLLSLGGIVTALHNEMPGMQKWSKANVAKMLANRAYLGEVIWCRRPHDKRERKEVRIRPRSEWVVTKNAHPAIVPAELFDQVQLRLAKNKRQTRATAGGYPLSGILHCAVCGSRYVGGGGRINYANPADLDRWRFYRCKGPDQHLSPCPGKMGTISKRLVESLVIAEVASVVSDPQVQDLIRGEIDRFLAELNSGSGDRRAELARQEKQFTAQRENLVRAIANGIITDDAAAATAAEVNAGLDRVAREMKALASADATAADVERARERLIAAAADFPAQAKLLKGPALRALLEPWIESAVYDKRTRSLSVTIRRVPGMPAQAGPAGLQPFAHPVPRVIVLPQAQRGGDGRWLPIT